MPEILSSATISGPDVDTLAVVRRRPTPKVVINPARILLCSVDMKHFRFKAMTMLILLLAASPRVFAQSEPFDESYAEYYSEHRFVQERVRLPKGFLCQRVVSGQVPLGQISEVEIKHEIQAWREAMVRQAFGMSDD